MKKIPEVVSMYFPQLHRIEENDRWWGPGFTDWDLVKRIPEDTQRPHRVPVAEVGYYDQSQRETVERQVVMARRYGIDAFCYYHYWFDGKILLESPLEHIKAFDMPFMLCWANETWSKRWVGKPNEVLVRQTYSGDPTMRALHYSYLAQQFSHPNYVKVDGRPVFVIYRPNDVSDLAGYIASLDLFLETVGLGPVLLIQNRVNHRETFDHAGGWEVNFQPRHFFSTLDRSSRLSAFSKILPRRLQELASALRYRSAKGMGFPYEDALSHIEADFASEKNGRKVFGMLFPDWDNTARYGSKAKFFVGVSPRAFEESLKRLLLLGAERGHEFVFINAWNEWSEGAYLEPDLDVGYANLEAVAGAKSRARQVLSDGN